MEDFNELMGKLSSSANDLNVAKLGEVVSYNPDTLTANIQLLPSDELDLIINVPVIAFESKEFYIYNPLEAGELVLVIFIDNDIDNFLMGQDSLNSGRQHSQIDAICIGGITRLSEPLEVEEKDNLYISQKDGKATIRISPDGELEIKTEDDITIETEKDLKIKAENIDIEASQVNIDKG